MDKASDSPTTAINPSQEKRQAAQPRNNNFNFKAMIISLNFLANPTRPEAQFTVHK